MTGNGGNGVGCRDGDEGALTMVVVGEVRQRGGQTRMGGQTVIGKRGRSKECVRSAYVIVQLGLQVSGVN